MSARFADEHRIRTNANCYPRMQMPTKEQLEQMEVAEFTAEFNRDSAWVQAELAKEAIELQQAQAPNRQLDQLEQ